jgi:hypothetical protein
MLRLSQGQLTLLAYCPRRFQHAVLDGLTVPPSPALLAGQQWGDRFHLLMQQREMGLAIADLLAQEPDLQASFNALQTTAPELFAGGEIFRQSEHGRSLIFNGHWFTVVYDLLRLWGDRGEIVDWKTYQQPKTLAYLQQDWQTRLYLYVLAETTALPPERLAMTYWFVRTRHPETHALAPQQVRVPYSASRHAQTGQDLQHLTTPLTDWLGQGNPLPQVPETSGKCDPCPFNVRCQRGTYQPSGDTALSDLGAIAEVTP